MLGQGALLFNYMSTKFATVAVRYRLLRFPTMTFFFQRLLVVICHVHIGMLVGRPTCFRHGFAGHAWIEMLQTCSSCRSISMETDDVSARRRFIHVCGVGSQCNDIVAGRLDGASPGIVIV